VITQQRYSDNEIDYVRSKLLSEKLKPQRQLYLLLWYKKYGEKFLPFLYFAHEKKKGKNVGRFLAL
jgi:hypothetical protein